MTTEEKWSEPERWAWGEIRAGRVADFNAHESNELDSKVPDGWTEGRKLRSEFLKEVLFREPYRSTIPVEGVRITGAWLPEPVDLANGHLDHRLCLDKCRFEQAVDLAGLRMDGWLSLAGSAFTRAGRTGTASVNLNGAEISGHVSMKGVSVAGLLALDFRGAKVRQLDMSGASVTGTTNMNGLQVHHLFMRGPDATFQEVDLGGAKVGGQVDMSGAAVAARLSMNGLEVSHLLIRGPNAAFRDVDLTGAKVGGQVDVTGATVAGTLNMNGLEVGQALLMRGPNAKFRDVDLRSAKVRDQLSLIGATVTGSLNMNALEVGHLLMAELNAHFREVDLTAAKVGGQLSLIGANFRGLNLRSATVSGQLILNGATVTEMLNMNGLEVGQHLLMRGPHATFRDVNLGSAKVGGQVDMTGATVFGALTMNSLQIGQHLLMWEATFEKRIELIFGRVGVNLDLSGADFSGAEFTGLDLSATRIEGELRLGSNDRPSPTWGKGARLTLRNTYTGVLQDCSDEMTDAWPKELRLAGFTYGRLGGFRSAEAKMLARDIDWYIRWLARDPSYIPQPYEHLAAVFRAAGEPAKADRILYESRERARQGAGLSRWLGLTMLKWTIGYGLGLRYFRALGWVLAITLISAGVLWLSGQPSEGLAAGLLARLIYSLDQLLPIVEFEKYDKVVLTGGVAYYFYAQKLIGWVLGSFLVAGLAGLTQK